MSEEAKPDTKELKVVETPVVKLPNNYVLGHPDRFEMVKCPKCPYQLNKKATSAKVIKARFKRHKDQTKH